MRPAELAEWLAVVVSLFDSGASIDLHEAWTAGEISAFLMATGAASTGGTATARGLAFGRGSVVSPPDANEQRTVWVFHFNTTEDPYATLQASGPFPAGSHVILFGGDDSPGSNGTLQSVLSYFEGNDRVTIDGIHASTGMFVDGNGNYVNRKMDRH
jgi:hypothetical protein